MLPIAKLSAAHSAIATRRGVVNMRIPQPACGLDQEAPGRTSRSACLTWRKARETTRGTATDTAMFRFATVVRALAVATLFGLAPLAFAPLALAPPAFAQPQAPLVGIDPIRASLDQIDAQARSSPGLR